MARWPVVWPAIPAIPSARSGSAPQPNRSSVIVPRDNIHLRPQRYHFPFRDHRTLRDTNDVPEDNINGYSDGDIVSIGCSLDRNRIRIANNGEYP